MQWRRKGQCVPVCTAAMAQLGGQRAHRLELVSARRPVAAEAGAGVLHLVVGVLAAVLREAGEGAEQGSGERPRSNGKVASARPLRTKTRLGKSRQNSTLGIASTPRSSLIFML